MNFEDHIKRDINGFCAEFNLSTITADKLMTYLSSQISGIFSEGIAGSIFYHGWTIILAKDGHILKRDFGFIVSVPKVIFNVFVAGNPADGDIIMVYHPRLIKSL